MLVLTVKGNRKLAETEAKKREIQFKFVKQTSHYAHGIFTVGDVPESYLSKVLAWYEEPPLTSPYPRGTLLHWNHGSRRSEDQKPVK